MTLLEQGLEKLNFPQTEIERLAPLMETYIKELTLFNSAYNLVNTSNHDEIVVRHILDSLSAKFEIEKLLHSTASAPAHCSLKIADIGSGGGLPGIPLAAALPQFDFVLVERMSKRCAFLENAAAILGLKNATVRNIELEKVPPQSFDVATFRAFRPLDKKMLGMLLAVLKNGGTLAAYKAKKEKIVEEMQNANCSEYKIIPLSVPFLTEQNIDERERNLVLIKNCDSIF